MILLLILNKLSSSQVIFLCNQQSDCYIDSYCNSMSECYECEHITPSLCDTLNTDCCSKEFLHQCVDNPYKCHIKNGDHKTIEDTKMDDGLYMFLLIFSISSISYISLGSYYNKYVKQKHGQEIFPNINFWINLIGLVKDGTYFSFNKCNGYVNNYTRIL
tara:strand:- start:658 stop:1137 length:480 start_codon:yes stop_codon:yes gene_type:complete